MDHSILAALASIEQAVRRSSGPLFTDSDWGRVLRSFLTLCQAMNDQDRQFKAKTAEAQRLVAAAMKERRARERQAEIDRLLAQLDEATDD